MVDREQLFWDLDSDGLADLAFANSSASVSFVYWNSPQGFLPNRRTQFPASGAHGIAIDDLDGDGQVGVTDLGTLLGGWS